MVTSLKEAIHPSSHDLKNIVKWFYFSQQLIVHNFHNAYDTILQKLFFFNYSQYFD